MKRTVIFLALCGFAFFARAQRFFYIEPDNIAAGPVRDDLSRASQFTTKSAALSDYTIKTAIAFGPEAGSATLNITVEDSITAKRIYQANEQYCFHAGKFDAQLALNMAVKMFVARNIPEIIFYAKNEHLMNAEF